jgi:hypothetical protein
MCLSNVLPPNEERISKWESKLKYKPIIKALSHQDNKIKSKAIRSLAYLFYYHRHLFSEQDQIVMRDRIVVITKTLTKKDGQLVFDCVLGLRFFNSIEVRDFYHSILKLEDVKELYDGSNYIDFLEWVIIGLCEKSGDGTTCELLMDLIEKNKLHNSVVAEYKDSGGQLLFRTVRAEGYDSEVLNIYCSKAVESKWDDGGSVAACLLRKAFDKYQKTEVKTWLNSKHLAVRKYAGQF